MAYMIDSITVTRARIYKGAARVVVSDPTIMTSFPGLLESVMNPSTPADGGTAYELATGWIDLGPTTEDGVTLRREAELSDGIALDQRNANLSEGEPESWSMQVDTEFMHTTLENLQKGWQGGDIRSYDASGSNVAQRTLTMDAPGSFTERVLAIIQEDTETGSLRMFAFRKATPKVDGSELKSNKADASGLPVSFTLKIDTSIASGYGEFGIIYEEGNP